MYIPDPLNKHIDAHSMLGRGHNLFSVILIVDATLADSAVTHGPRFKIGRKPCERTP